MSKFEFVKEPGILLDAMFLLKLRFNGESAYSCFRGEIDHTEQDEKFYELMRAKTMDINEKLLPLFYCDTKNDGGTPLLAYMRANWETLMQEPDAMIDAFYALLEDWSELKTYIFLHYFPGSMSPVFNPEGMENVRTQILDAELPVDVKLYLLDFFLSSDSACPLVVREFQKAVGIALENWQQNKTRIEEKIRACNEKTMGTICQSMNIPPDWCSGIYYTYCCTLRKTIASALHGDNGILLYIGIHADRYIDSVRAEPPIDFYELGRCIYDETRLKILSMLRNREMYCAEIARELGLKNNSTIYHLNMLHSQKLLRKRTLGNKLLYRLNVDFLLTLDEYLRSIIEETSMLEHNLAKTDNKND